MEEEETEERENEPFGHSDGEKKTRRYKKKKYVTRFKDMFNNTSNNNNNNNNYNRFLILDPVNKKITDYFDKRDFKLAHIFPMLLVHHSKKVMLFALLFPLVMSLSILITDSVDLNPIGNFYARSLGDVELQDAFQAVQLAPIMQQDADQVKQTQQSIQRFLMYTVYESMPIGSNIFTPSRLNALYKMEKELLSTPLYDSLCLMSDVQNSMYQGYESVLIHLLTPENGCDPPLSIIPLFFQSFKDLFIALCSMPNVTLPQCYSITNSSLPNGRVDELIGLEGELRISLILTALADEEILKSFSSFFFDKDFSKDNLESSVTRSLFLFGLPLPGYENINDHYSEQYQSYKDLILAWVEILTQSNTDFLSVMYQDFDFITTAEILTTIVGDAWYAVGSFLFVFACLTFQTRSVFLAISGTLEIFASLPMAQFFYTFVFGYESTTVLNFLALFIVAGVGADDIFVYMDCWRQAEAIPEVMVSLDKRSEYVFRTSIKAITITSFTTCAAFAMTALSPIPTISALGIFASCAIFCNYILVIMWFAPSVLVYHKHFSGCRKRWVKFRDDRMAVVLSTLDLQEMLLDPLPIQDSEELAAKISASNLDPDAKVSLLRILESRDPSFDSEKPIPSPKQTRTIEIEKLGAIERFFHSRYFPFLFRLRWVVLIVFGLLFVFNIVVTTQIEPAHDLEKYFKDTHPIQRIFALSTSEFMPTSIYLEEGISGTVVLNIVWGILGIDRSGLDPNSHDLGSPIFDSNFGVNNPEEQKFLLYLCNITRQREDLVRDGESACWIEGWRDWIELNETNYTFPVEQEQANEMIFRFFQEKPKPYFRPEFNLQVGFTGEISRPSYAYLSFNTSLTFIDFLSLVEGLRIFNKYQTMVEEYNVLATELNLPRLAHAFQASPDQWINILSRAVIVRSAVIGILFSLGLAFLVLVIATANWWIAVLATLTIFLILLQISALMVLYGWEVGVTESVCLCILVGLSVDFVVHLAHAYNRSPGMTRFEKCQDAVTSMGISVSSGAISTAGACVFLFFSVIIFFATFGAFIATTITVSLLYSLIPFISMLATFGPVGNQGSLSSLYQFLKESKTRCWKKSPEEPEFSDELEVSVDNLEV